jgi:2-polyprenyl-6-hydroxyphenyl methylase/3-demethylubiquinone-9 3-methyltransferase
MAETNRTLDRDEVARFARLAGEWWDANGPFKPLHRINPVRLIYIRDRLCRRFARDAKAGRSLDGLSVLDIGCGGGLVAQPLARLGATVTGIDISEEMLRHARRYEAAEPRGIAYVQGDAEDIAAFAGTTFDGVVCHMALDAGGVPGLLYARARRCEGRAPKS